MWGTSVVSKILELQKEVEREMQLMRKRKGNGGDIRGAMQMSSGQNGEAHSERTGREVEGTAQLGEKI